MSAAEAAGPAQHALVADWYAFTLSFKGVLLEGLEVAFIVIAFGSNQGSIPLAVLGAVIAVVLVSLAEFLALLRHLRRHRGASAAGDAAGAQ